MAVLGKLVLSLFLGLSFGAAPAVARTDIEQPAGSHYTVAWLNAWAAWHTAAGGDAAWAMDAPERMRIVVDHLRNTHADLGVLAEVERTQVDAFRREAGGDLALVTGGNALDNVVFYRPSVFRLVSQRHFWTYYVDGAKVITPVVVLAARNSGAEVAVIPVHDPATRPGIGSQSAWRARDAAAIAREVRRLGGVPAVVAGDFNDHTGILCDLTGAAGLNSPLAGHAACRHPSGDAIDQVFVSPALPYRGYRSYEGDYVRRATDHGRFYELTIDIPLPPYARYLGLAGYSEPPAPRLNPAS